MDMLAHDDVEAVVLPSPMRRVSIFIRTRKRSRGAHGHVRAIAPQQRRQPDEIVVLDNGF